MDLNDAFFFRAFILKTRPGSGSSNGRWLDAGAERLGVGGMREGQQPGLRGGGGVCPSLHLARSPFCHPGPNPPSSSLSPPVLALGSARTHTLSGGRLAHTARTRNGDGREPEPVHHGLPSRPLVMEKETLFFKLSVQLAHPRNKPHTPPRAQPNMKDEAATAALETSVTTLS